MTYKEDMNFKTSKDGFFKLYLVKPIRLIVVVCLYHFVELSFDSWCF
jgi:hypothetical protein